MIPVEHVLPSRRVVVAVSAAALVLLAGAAQGQGQAPEAPLVQTLERVTIDIGRGQLRSVQGLNRAELDDSVAGSSPLLMVARLPGVSFQSADALGNYEWSARFTVRAFNQDQLGFTLDDVPLGDMSYGNSNGLHLSRAISSENVARVQLSQGMGALETASSSNLGGTLQTFSIKPAKQFGLQARQTLGTERNSRTFLRLNSGATGVGEFMLSVTDQRADKWKGEGAQRQQQLNLKYVGEWSTARLSAFLNTSRRREIDYQDMSLAMLSRLGSRWDNFYPDFGAALRAANSLCGNAGSKLVAECDDAYYAGSGLRDDELAGATLETALSERLRAKATVYYHHNRGAGLWFTPYAASPGGTPISIRTTEYAIYRGGLIATADYTLGAHQLKLGLWHEDNDFDQARRFYAVSPTAVPSPYEFLSQPYRTQWQYGFNTRTWQLSLSDTVTLNNGLTLGFGFKSLRADIAGELQRGSDKPSGQISARGHFLPQLGLNYQLSASDEVFVAAARNMRAFQAAATGITPYSTTAAGFEAIKGSLKPETSDTLELGWRHQSARQHGALTLYAVQFKDRLLGVQLGSAIQGNPTVLANVGAVHALGLEAAWSLRLATSFNWYNSLSLNRSRYQDDVLSNGKTVAIAGKQKVDTPEVLFKSILGFEDGGWFGNVGLDHMSLRYYSYLNDASVAGRTLVNLSAGYRSNRVGAFSRLSLQVGITNLSNQTYLATMGTNGFSNSDPTGSAQTLLPGAPRQVFLTLRADL